MATQGKAKRPRSEAQKAAFARAVAVRDANLLAAARARESETAQVAANADGVYNRSAVVPVEERAPQDQTPQEPMKLSPVVSQDASVPLQMPQERAPMHQPQAAQLEPDMVEDQALDMEQDSDDEYEYFDVSELKDHWSTTQSQLQQTREELAQLRETIDTLSGRQDTIASDWRNHGIRQALDLNFV